MRTQQANSGFTLIETTAALAIVTLIAVGLVSVSQFLADREQIALTQSNLYDLRSAINGNPVIVANEARTSFGYLGDMGKLPVNVQDLWVKGAQPAFAFDTSKKAGAGWNGPYLEVSPSEFASTLARDGWGNALFYSTSPFVDSSFNATVLGKLASLGPDFTLGSSDDIAINFFQAEVLSRVQGFVKDTGGNVVSGVGITVNYPQNGLLTSQSAYTDAAGYYTVPNVPFGNRSLTIDPMLVLAPGTTVVSGTSNEDLRFTVKNYAATAIGVTSISMAYTIAPDAWFSLIRVNGANVYNSTNPRVGDGDTITFSQRTASGTGLTKESILINLQSAISDVADLIIGKVGAGGSLIIELRGFFDARTGGSGDEVDVTGVSFEITFRNSLNAVVGSVVVSP